MLLFVLPESEAHASHNTTEDVREKFVGGRGAGTTLSSKLGLNKAEDCQKSLPKRI